jgi:hypothetical protein
LRRPPATARRGARTNVPIRTFVSGEADLVQKPSAPAVDRGEAPRIPRNYRRSGDGTPLAIPVFMRRVFGEILMTAGAVAILIIVLAASNDRVRDQLASGMAMRPGQVSSLMTRVEGGTDVLLAVARAESRAHTPMILFTVAGAILVVFMLRT